MKEKLPKVREGNTWVWGNGKFFKIDIIDNWSLAFDFMGNENRDWSWMNMLLKDDEQTGVVYINCVTNLAANSSGYDIKPF